MRELLNYEVHPSPMNWIARTYIDQGEYDSARIWYQRSIDASAGLNQKEVGVALHGLATIDLRKGDYEAARENFEKAMKISAADRRPGWAKLRPGIIWPRST